MPIVISLDEAAEKKKLFSFMNSLRRPNVAAAEKEALRLAPYFKTMAKLSCDDFGRRGGRTEKELRPIKSSTLASLFNTIAKVTNNTVLSEMLLLPDVFGGYGHSTAQDRLREKREQEVKNSNSFFGGSDSYNGRTYTFGFLQVFERNKKGDEKSSTSIPIFAFDAELLKVIAPHRPQKMFRDFQTVMTYGNHDMLHHFTNTYLNNSIAQTFKDGAGAGYFDWQEKGCVVDWSRRNFSHVDEDPKSLESWLVLNHARIRKAMEGSADDKAMRRSVDGFFDELKRIGEKYHKEMKRTFIAQTQRNPGVLSQEWAFDSARQAAHVMTDYFGTMLLYAMMRFMPLDHPLIDHAIDRLEGLDSDPSLLAEEAWGLTSSIRAYKKDGVGGAVYGAVHRIYENYKRSGVLLIDQDADEYKSIKKHQMISMLPWMAALLAPVPPISGGSKREWNENGDLREAKNRVGRLNASMLRASAKTVNFQL